MSVVNNVDVDKAARFTQQVREDPAKGWRSPAVEGDWVLEGPAEFRGRAGYEGGEAILRSSTPSFLGGTGTSPAPMQHFLFGFSACFASTYAAEAAALGVILTRLSVRAEADVDFGPSLGLSETPPVRGIRLSVDIAADAPEDTLRHLADTALEHSRVGYAVTREMPVATALRRTEA
jgi:uncharacterized OsmC-like protein